MRKSEEIRADIEKLTKELEVAKINEAKQTAAVHILYNLGWKHDNRKGWQKPAPVVPDDVRQALSKMDDEIIAELDVEENACRAAMLQAQSDDDGEPTDDERIMAIEGMIGCLRCGDNGWVVGEMGITRCACAQAGNSPVIGIDMASGPDRTVEVRSVGSSRLRNGAEGVYRAHGN